jgi:CubicO group peptidase (beta-lactamase class C family)
MKRITILILIFVMMAFVAVWGYDFFNYYPDQKAEAADFKSKLDTEIPKLMESSGTPGAVIISIDGDNLSRYEYGFCDKSKGRAMTADTVMQVGSISKSVTAWGVMKLVENGRIELDSPVEKYIKSWHLPESKYGSNGVTIRRLLSHTAGLSLQGYAGVKPGDKLPSIQESLSGKTGGAGDVRIVCEPGSYFLYSGGGYTLLQLMIEEVSGMPFVEYMEKEVLKPLQMNDSAFELKEELKPRTSRAYGVLGQELPNYLFTEKAAAGLDTTANDLAKFAMAGMTGFGSSRQSGVGVLKPETVALMEQMIGDTGWGLGYEIFEIYGGEKIVGHAGTNRGWRAKYYIAPDSRQGLLVLTNSDNGEVVAGTAWSLWVEHRTGKLPMFYIEHRQMDKKVHLLAGLLGIALLAFWSIFLIRIRKKERAFVQWDKLKVYGKLIRLLPLLLVFVWWAGLYGPVIHGWNIAEFLPVSFKWISVVVTLWCFSIMIISIFPKMKDKDSSKELKA